MLVSEFLQQTNDALRATDDDVPTIGTDEANYWIRTALRIRRNLFRDTSKQWSSTYQVVNLGTIAAGNEPNFGLEVEFLHPASTAYVIKAGQRTDIDIVEPQNTDHQRQAVFIAGADPQTLFFTKPILAADQIVGGTLFLPGYIMPDPFANANDTVVVDDPDWLLMATAAAIAAADLTYEDRAADLNSAANALYRVMTANNRRGTSGNPRISRYNMPQITSPDRR
jgi:hypothetical protein